MFKIATAVAMTIGLVGAATAAEFQPLGTLGMGGAGVARSMGGYAPYWNPAGLAFADKSVSTVIGAGAGLRVSDGLADNVDRLSKFTEGSTLSDLENLILPPPPSLNGPKAVADTVNLLTVLNDFAVDKGAMSVNANATLGFQVKQFGFGAFVLTEGFGQPIADVDPATQTLRNVLPLINGSQSTASQLALLSGAAPGGYTPTIMTTAQRDQMATDLGITSGEANNIINAVETNLSATSTITPLSASQASTTLTTTLVDAFNNGGTIDSNRSAVMIKNVAFAEFPVSYGHPFKISDTDRLALGGSIKAVIGRVYQTRVQVLEAGESISSEDIVDAMDDNYTESTNVTIDLGLQWKHGDWLTVGVVGKNLTSPKFKSPYVEDMHGLYVDVHGVPEGQAGFAGRYRDNDVTLKPQARLGVAVNPLAWLTIAADVDLTENETVLSTNDYKSRHLGGGVEVHPLSWLKLRGGLYKNIANSEVGPVATAGFTFGVPAFALEVDAAYGLDETTYDEDEYPKESRVQAQFTLQF